MQLSELLRPQAAWTTQASRPLLDLPDVTAAGAEIGRFHVRAVLRIAPRPGTAARSSQWKRKALGDRNKMSAIWRMVIAAQPGLFWMKSASA